MKIIKIIKTLIFILIFLIDKLIFLIDKEYRNALKKQKELLKKQKELEKLEHNKDDLYIYLSSFNICDDEISKTYYLFVKNIDDTIIKFKVINGDFISDMKRKYKHLFNVYIINKDRNDIEIKDEFQYLFDNYNTEYDLY